MKYGKIFESIKIGNLQLPHRILMGSMHLGLEGLEDAPDRMVSFYQRRFDGGASIITTGGISVNHEGKGHKNFYSFQEDEHCKKLEKVNNGLKGKGILCAQLFHAGRYSYHRELVAPSPLRAPINRFVPRELSEKEAWQTIEDFGTSAKKARETGFGAVEIMGSEGYLINQFFSPVTNKRSDFFGGNHEKRMNFAIEAMKSVKKHAGFDFPVIFRVSGIDLIPGAPDFDEVLELCKKISANGADALNIGIGWHESRVPTISMLVPRGSWAKIAGKIKTEITTIPIIASNRINNPDTILTILENKNADIVSMARPFLADPDLVQKIKNNSSDRINTCVACNQACLDHTFKEETVSCLVNPEANRESEFRLLQPTKKLHVIVVGGGAGGMEAARALAIQGHKTKLYEASPKLGGQLNYASMIPGKDEFKETIRYFTNELKSLNVDLIFNTNVTIELLERENPDAIIFATGVRPRKVTIPGLEKIHHGDYVEFLTGKFTPGKKVIIIGGGGIGCDSAHKILEDHNRSIEEYFKLYNVQDYKDPKLTVLKQAGKQITIMRRNGKIGSGLGQTTGWALIQELQTQGVEMLTSLDYKEITEQGLKIQLKSGEVRLVECDSIILCAGQTEDAKLAEEYSKKYPSKTIRIIGGARSASGLDAKRAIREGTEAARGLGIQ